jgi:hypothetical protein
MLRPSLRALLAAAAAVACSPASAALLDYWDTDSVSTTVTTNNDLGPGATVYPWRNILKFWFAQDDTKAYFRMDLQGGPGGDNNVALDALLYAVYLDSDNNIATGASGDGSPYLYWDGSEVLGIDAIIDAHYDTDGAKTQEHVHSYTGRGLTLFDTVGYSTFGVVGEFDNGNHRIEWSAPLAGFGLNGDFVVYAAVYDVDTPTESFDLARLDIAAAPLPATWLLLAPGLLLLRRSHRARS